MKKQLESYCRPRETKEIKAECNVKSLIISWRKNSYKRHNWGNPGAGKMDWILDTNFASMFRLPEYENDTVVRNETILVLWMVMLKYLRVKDLDSYNLLLGSAE